MPVAPCLAAVLQSSKALGCGHAAVRSTHALVGLHGAGAPSPGDWNAHGEQHSYLWSSAGDSSVPRHCAPEGFGDACPQQCSCDAADG